MYQGKLPTVTSGHNTNPAAWLRVAGEAVCVPRMLPRLQLTGINIGIAY